MCITLPAERTARYARGEHRGAKEMQESGEYLTVTAQGGDAVRDLEAAQVKRRSSGLKSTHGLLCEESPGVEPTCTTSGVNRVHCPSDVHSEGRIGVHLKRC